MSNIVVQIAKNFERIEANQTRIEKLVEAVFSRFNLSKATVSIALIDDAEICKANKQFLNSNYPTDVISFDLSDSVTDSAKLFELLINAERAIREAALRGHSSEAELSLYIIHGLLHNLGFSDSTQNEAKQMHDIEDEILQQQGFGLVYNTQEY